ncbi:MAG: hypothetical protein JWO36_2253 [Myxococcales bacterium]|nr:hypothetical protein [Myxococcales bacterium]
MTSQDFETYVNAAGYATRTAPAGSGSYLVLTVLVPSGSNKGKSCEVAVKRSDANPWVPESAVHVKPHLVPMGQQSSQNSELGGEWQYLSRRFERPPTPKAFLAHLFTVLGET